MFTECQAYVTFYTIFLKYLLVWSWTDYLCYAMQCYYIDLHAFNHYLLQELLHREIMIWMSKNYCRWSIIGEEGEVLWIFVHFRPWDTSVYENMIRANWFTCFEEHVAESSYKGFLIRSELELNIGFFPGIWFRCIIRLLGIQRFIVSCISGDIAIQKQARLFLPCT
jgi:hypothetical protein